MYIFTKPFDDIRVSPIISLIANDEQVDTDDFGASVGVSLDEVTSRRHSGEILSAILYSAKTGATGAIQTPFGWLYVCDSNPAVAAGDTVMSAAETVIGRIQINAPDWEADATSGTAYKQVAIPFPSVHTLYFVFKNEGAAINDGADDDETVSMRFVWRRDG